MHARCRNILGSEDEAWDATQDIFMKLIKSYKTIQKKQSLLSWLYTSATHHCISVLRKKRGVAFEENIHSPGRENREMEKKLLLKDVVERLLRPWDRKTREVIVYTYVDGYNQQEIARLTGMGESTIRRHLTKFRRKAKDSPVFKEGYADDL